MAKFVRLELGSKIVKIHSSLSGTVILDQEGRVLLLGRFGKMNYSMPFMLNPGQDKYYDCKAGD